MQQLPTGRQVFENIRKEKLLYVDKTALLYNLITQGRTQFFLSRPRRFGKTLLCYTLKSIFEGKKELFKGLAISKTKWKWEKYPVIKLDMSDGAYGEGISGCKEAVMKQLFYSAQNLGIEFSGETSSSAFKSLILDSAKKYGKPAVVIIDEYDNPLLSVIDKKEAFNDVRIFLRDFYKVVKANENDLRFTFITGITKFAQVSVFSALNNLTDMTLDPEYSTLLGITQEELEKDFADYIEKWAKEYGGKKKYIEKLKDSYNGYRFTENPQTVYNPFCLLKHFDSGKFQKFWFETATPSYLINLLDSQKIDILNIKDFSVATDDFKKYDSDNMDAVPVLYQSGYLTVKDYDKESDSYILGYPNKEVESAFASELATKYLKVPGSEKSSFAANVTKWLYVGEPEKIIADGFIPFMASIPYSITIPKEKYFQTIFHIIFNIFGFQCRSEVQIATGRIDSILETPKFVYCFEFKLKGTAAEALKQIDSREYLTPWKGKGKTLFKIGVSFDHKKRKIKEWKINAAIRQQP
ncbi:MAG: ATP-binding protein [Candidatus Fibromonas sp.]|nr:ATP-binding protein [Candidatus Fibromonas sp.]